jgi:hypothetical protein
MKEVRSRSFELRYFSSDPAANGETDFKGPASVMDTEQRVRYLSHYARYAGRFFDNPRWDQPVVTDEEAADALRRIKPQPLPSIRKRLPLRNWKWIGSREGKAAERAAALREWAGRAGTELRKDQLVIKGGGAPVPFMFKEQNWRFFLQWTVKLSPGAAARFTVGRLMEIGCDQSGELYCEPQGGERIPCGSVDPHGWHTFRVEADLVSGGANLYLDDALRADFVGVPQGQPVGSLTMASDSELAVRSVWGTGFEPEELPDGVHGGDVPFRIHTFIDETFRELPGMENWAALHYDDSLWEEAELPFAYGGERYAGEDLYLRHRVAVGSFARAYLCIEALDPGGEVWINGRVVAVRHDRHPVRMDVTPFLLPNQPNVIAIRVFPNQVDVKMRHTSSDRHTGWFAGRVHLDLTEEQHIEDVFVFTRSIHEDMAVAQVEVTVKNDRRPRTSGEALNHLHFDGRIEVEWTPWFPDEGEPLREKASFPIRVEMGRSLTLKKSVRIPTPMLWTAEHPKLYKVRVILCDAGGTPLDDEAVTTGIRTVSQEGGVFRVNGKPDMMNGALLFGFRYPIDKLARWDRCAPAEWIVRDLLMLKRLNGNTARMSHHNSMIGSINDPRYAEIGDQLGIYYQWATSAWVRDASPWLLDFEGLPKYVRQVRNHPSIVMWQPSNHPSFENFDSAMPWYERVYETIYSLDPSRLICPTANLTRMKARSDDGTITCDGKPVAPIAVWTAPGISRGNMDHAVGYGADWSVLRCWPKPPEWEGADGWRDEGFKSDYLSSAERAYFDFENEESIGQPNWLLARGKPEYKIKSYEWGYDEGSIGRELTFEEWEESQAWQAFSAYEAIRKKRWLGYDGFAWCTLRGGGNNGTYMKPLSDYYGHGKIAFYTVAMAYQKLLAGSGDADIVYGPEDEIKPIVLNVGPGYVCRLTVTVRTLDGAIAARRTYDNIVIPPGKTVTKLPGFRPEVMRERYYAVEYEIHAQAGNSGNQA